MLVWKLHTLDYRIASVRYRAVLPIRALASRGTRSVVCHSLGVDQLQGAEAVIFVKAFALKDLMFAQRACELGVPIVLDLCDNIFVPNYTLKFPLHPAEIIQVMARYASVITTTGPALSTVLTRELESRVPIIVVTDGVESAALSLLARRLLRRAFVNELFRMLVSVSFWMRVTPKIWSKGSTKLALWWARSGKAASVSLRIGPKRVLGMSVRNGSENKSLTREPRMVRTLIWFGHGGGDYGQFGISDIVSIAPFLGALSRRVAFRLIVVSNNREAYERLVRPLPIDTEYVEWDSDSIRDRIKASDVTIVPNSRDPFAICKSANRAVLSLSLGVPAVVTRTPAMNVLEGCVTFDDWVEGPYRYFVDPELVQSHLRKARTVLEKEFSPHRIADQWQEVLKLVKATPVVGGKTADGVSDRILAVVIHLMQDFDLALPVLTAARRGPDVRCQAWVSLALLEDSPRVWTGLREHGIDFRVMDDQSDADVTLMDFRGIGAVLTIAETNQSPHRFPHRLAKQANAAGVPTYTMQHGFENIGLTYTDSKYPIDRITFASNVIFIWGRPEALHPEVPAQTRRKCVPVGCCKTVPREQTTLPLPVKRNRVIGIFENLHWDRYDKSYAEQFVRDVQTIAEQNPETMFVVKPHHAGRWLTSRYEEAVPHASNLVIADPASPMWERFTASQMLASLDAVITTPSTVALDAARAGKPVAVVGYRLDLSMYRPLTILTDSSQWQDFIGSLGKKGSQETLRQQSEAFVLRTVCGRNAAGSILLRIAADMGVVLADENSAAWDIDDEGEHSQKAVECRTR